MPELPDVEIQCRYLAKTSLNKRIKSVKVLDDYVIKGVPKHEFESRLEGAKFEEVDRCGKFLEVSTDSRYDLAFHFGMTGHLKYIPTNSHYDKYARVILTMHACMGTFQRRGKRSIVYVVDVGRKRNWVK
jgi:formamidopyrimidine-DNA glycosylase